MSKEYNPNEIEKKWQDKWAADNIYNAEDAVEGKDNEYVLVEFAYPSGNLHVGHWYAFSVPDMYARYRRMQGKNVMYPMGFDAFGLPAENAAIKNKVNPREWTFSNIEYMKNQLRSMGASFDWSREVVTASPEYYRWTQWLFLKFMEKGLAYQSETPVNWCPGCKTVLANEQVVAGECERCGTQVEKRNMLQWNLKITDYADRLIDDLEELDWPKPIKEAQKNWIGRSEGAEISFEMQSHEEPTFYQFSGPSTIRDDQPFVEREAIMAIVKHWSEDKYIGLKWKKVDWETLITGGVEEGQTPEEAARAEIQEETGYKNMKMVKDLGTSYSKFFHVPKDHNRFGRFHLLYFELEDGERDEISEEEQENHEVVWLAKEEMENFKMPSSHRHVWDTLTKKDQMPQKEVKVFTTRPDTIFGATYLVLAPEHPAVEYYIHQSSNCKEVYAYLNDVKRKTDIERQAEGKEKTGVRLDGVTAINPATKEEIPVWVADYVLPHYGTGAIMAVPSDDERDREFAEKFNLPIVEGYKPAGFEDYGKKTVQYKLRDWVVSRQRYWGCPIPVIHCKECGTLPVPESDLPVVLPEVEDYLPGDDGKSPLAKATTWVKTNCPKCGEPAERETDTLDTFVDSSWYFLRYADSKNEKTFAAKEKLKKWMPVELYSGGAEHTNMHLLYSRFFHKALFDMGLVNENEPYKRRMNRGIILGPDGHKMSKSKGNVVDPDKEVERLGADTVRIYLAFIGPYNEVGSYPWNPDSAVGVRRFLEKVWRLQTKISPKHSSLESSASTLMHQTIKKVSDELSSLKMNTAVSALMIYVNNLDKKEEISQEEYETLLLLLAPFAPHMTEELWEIMGHDTSIHIAPWLKYDEEALVEEEVTLAVQINGKVRADLRVAKDAPEEEVKSLALKLPQVEKWLGDKEAKRVVYVPGKVINIVVD